MNDHRKSVDRCKSSDDTVSTPLPCRFELAIQAICAALGYFAAGLGVLVGFVSALHPDSKTGGLPWLVAICGWLLVVICVRVGHVYRVNLRILEEIQSKK